MAAKIRRTRRSQSASRAIAHRVGARRGRTRRRKRRREEEAVTPSSVAIPVVRGLAFEQQRATKPKAACAACKKGATSCPKCAQRGKKTPPSKFSPRLSRGFKTECDVAVHPDYVTRYLLGQSIKTVGTGTPKIIELNSSIRTDFPCLYEVSMVHEQVHVENSKPYCAAFKQCVDDNTWSIIGEPTISKSKFDACKATHSEGKMPSCQDDENLAYTASIEKATNLMAESRCAAEKTNLKNNIALWQGYKSNAPNCS